MRQRSSFREERHKVFLDSHRRDVLNDRGRENLRSAYASLRSLSIAPAFFEEGVPFGVIDTHWFTIRKSCQKVNIYALKRRKIAYICNMDLTEQSLSRYDAVVMDFRPDNCVEKRQGRAVPSG
jgi:hypothetical protein